MPNLKAEKYIEDTHCVEGARMQKSDHPATSRPDIFSKFVRLVGLWEFRGHKSLEGHCESSRPEHLVNIGGGRAHTPVTVHFSCGRLPTSKSQETLRSSSDSTLTVSAAEDGGKPQGTVTNTPWTHVVDGSRAKTERQSTRRRAKLSPLSESTTSLTPIPEAASVHERNSLISAPAPKKLANFADEDALMETDSIRARAAIAMARAQLEHSRPASYFRKIERSSNRMMMLPGELEEQSALQAAKARGEKILAQLDTNEKPKLDDHADEKVQDNSIKKPGEEDVGSMQKTVGQSQAMVLTLMAAKEAVSQRTIMRKKSHSPTASLSTQDLPKLKRPDKPFQGLYQAGDIPPSPPPSIPLPRLPSRGAATLNASNDLEGLRRSKAPREPIAYNGLPTEYRSNNDVLQHIDMLMQSLLDSHPETPSELEARRPYCSLPSRRGRHGTGSTMDDSALYVPRSRPAEPPVTPLSAKRRSSSMRQMKRPSQKAACSQSPASPLLTVPVITSRALSTQSAVTYSDTSEPSPRAYCELEFGALPSSKKASKSLGFNHYGPLLHPSRAAGVSTHPKYGSHSRSASPKSSLSPISSGNTEKHFRQFTSTSSLRSMRYLDRPEF